MKEILMTMLSELKECLEAKELELKNKPNFNSHTQGEINNRKVSIENFEYSIQQVTNNPTMQYTILNNFKNNAEKIKMDIDKINCEND